MKTECGLQSLVENATHEMLDYTIYGHSSYSGSYHPRNICVNNPTEQSSRWSSGSHDQSQYVTIKLEKPAVACRVLFGKFHRSHVCNLKEFKIYGGLTPNDMKELLHKGLTDDNKSETFSIRYTYNDLVFPIQYLKILPLATFGANFNYSIWYVEVRGIKDKELMTKVYNEYNNYKEVEAIRLCLKYFRQRNMMDIHHKLKTKTNLNFEHPLVTQLHQSLVIEGDFEKAEQVIKDADEKNNAFKVYVEEAKYLPTWQKINASSQDNILPCARGGHQLCLDSDRERIYLFGGWDGRRELSDFWCYHIKENQWKLQSANTSSQGGPSSRSCHAICYDPTRKSIFVLGRYIERRYPSVDDIEMTFESDFYQYFIELDRWVKISDNTQIDGGPALLFDHQMCVDPIDRILYVFGGRIVDSELSSSNSYSGLYAYDMDNSAWRVVRHDIDSLQSPRSTTSQNILHHLHAANDSSIGRRGSSNGSHVSSPSISQVIKSRASHSMLLDPTTRQIYIFGGHRNKESLTDLYIYNIKQDKITEITHDFAKQFGPDAGYTQRASINLARQEIYIFSGFLKTSPNRVVRDCLWVYDITNNVWKKVYENDNHDSTYWKQMAELEPCPRYTHQIIFNKNSGTHYVFGGNPGDPIYPSRRLNDFWELKLAKSDSTQVVRNCLYLIRTRKLLELCKKADLQFSTNNMGQAHKHNMLVSEDTILALGYLRDYVAPIVDYDDKEQIAKFQQLCTHLCISEDSSIRPSYPPYSTTKKPDTAEDEDMEEDNCFHDRTEVYQALLEFFPANMKEPSGTLIDAVQIN